MKELRALKFMRTSLFRVFSAMHPAIKTGQIWGVNKCLEISKRIKVYNENPCPSAFGQLALYVDCGYISAVCVCPQFRFQHTTWQLIFDLLCANQGQTQFIYSETQCVVFSLQLVCKFQCILWGQTARCVFRSFRQNATAKDASELQGDLAGQKQILSRLQTGQGRGRFKAD